MDYFSRAVDFAIYFLKDQSSARDVVNDVFLEIWENQRIQFDSTSKSYLFRSVKNRSINALKKQGRLVPQNESDEPYSNSLEEHINLQATAKAVRRAIDELPTRCRQVFLLKRYSGLSNNEVAELLAISHKTVENQMTKAIKHLKKRLV